MDVQAKPFILKIEFERADIESADIVQHYLKVKGFQDKAEPIFHFQAQIPQRLC